VTDSSRIAEMCDAVSAIAAAYVPQVRSVFGVGTGKIAIPAGPRTGQLIDPFPGAPSESWQHVTNLPTAAAAYRSGTVTEVTWEIPFRLYVGLPDEAELRRQLSEIYTGYLAAFAKNVQLLGTAPSGAIARLSLMPGSDANWSWLGGSIPYVERLNLENAA
jgi:hypothetical protein